MYLQVLYIDVYLCFEYNGNNYLLVIAPGTLGMIPATSLGQVS